MKRSTIWILALLLSAGAARADVMVLVHGYLGSAASWDLAGVTPVLEANGWRRAGVLGPVPGGLLTAAPGEGAGDKFYLAQLPAEAPLLLQAEHLVAQLKAVAARHPGEALVLVGHSAGGVVARAVLLRQDAPAAAALVTIASPHLGTALAGEALEAGDIPFPFCLVPSFFGGESWDVLKRSRALYVDLLPPHPGSLLDGLNRSAHPQARYVSVVRGAPALWGDRIVPGWSQDMNNVPGLAGRSEVVVVPSDHFLSPADGFAILQAVRTGV